MNPARCRSAAKRMGVGVELVVGLHLDGKIEGFRADNGRTFVSKASVQALIERMRAL